MKKIAHIIDVDMGYGHARAAFALRDLGGGEVLSANNYPGIPQRDQELWQMSRKVYETISWLKPVPIIGDLAFRLMDQFQEIPAFYPRRDLSHPSIQLQQIYRLIRRGQGRDLIDRLRQNPLPIVTTFFTVVFMADYWDIPERFIVSPPTRILPVIGLRLILKRARLFTLLPMVVALNDYSFTVCRKIVLS